MKKPTTAEVREAFVYYAVPGMSKEQAEKAFDAWLEETTDVAYDEGRESGLASAAIDAQYAQYSQEES